jgi:formamidopyrimidine-DNA glycosylase
LVSQLPISEALLDQSILAGVGNIAKSEILYLARLDPRIRASRLSGQEMDRLFQSTQDILWRSYHAGGRWERHIYQRAGKPCKSCGGPIQSLSLAPSRRAIFYCPQCQAADPAFP